MTFIFPKKLELIPIFIKIATLKVLFKEKKTNVPVTPQYTVMFYDRDLLLWNPPTP